MLCENCIHTEVCGIEGYYEEALKCCIHHVDNDLIWIEDAPGIYRCPNCGHTEGKKRNFCCDCGSKFNEDE